jgi:hypothetical protein
MCFRINRARKTTIILLFLGMALAMPVAGEIYKWTDKHGHVHYSDRAPQNKPAETLVLEDTNIISSQGQELWDFRFDGRRWQLAHQNANPTGSIREYVLANQTADDWTELVTSLHMDTLMSVEEFFGKIMKTNPDCPSMEVSVIEQRPGTIIFKGKHGACGGFEPGEYLQRLSQIDGGILHLSFAQKGQLTQENLRNWTKILKQAKTRTKTHERVMQSPSMTLSQLGPLPDNTVSEYIETVSTGISVKPEKLSAQFTIRLKARRGLPAGAYLEVHFPDPADINKKDIESKVLASGETQAFIISPAHRDIKCWNYEILVYVYRGASKTKLLGTHRQVIQSRVNYARVKDDMDLVSAMRNGRCP